VELALLEQAANGITLDAGQAALVRFMSMSGARLKLAIAPAGPGKTTALRSLTRAWTDGGQVLGLGPRPRQPPSCASKPAQRRNTSEADLVH
jgi:AAA domain